MRKSEFNDVCQCQCRCGEVKIIVKKPPIARLYCHCLVCREVYGKAFSDMTLAWSSSIDIDDVSKIEFKSQRFFPITVKCGTCKTCKHPVAGYSMALSFFNIALIPSYMYQQQTDVPKSSGHIFYHSRVCDVEDDLPKYYKFLGSELAVARFILSAITGFA